MTWRNRSACLNENPDVFFPVGTGQPARLQTERAKDVHRPEEGIEHRLDRED